MAPAPPLDLLPTTVMERYFSRPSHGNGMVFSITLVLEGAMEIEPLRRAWFDTVHRHPRMYAKLVGRGRRQQWKLQTQADHASFVYRDVAADTSAATDDAESVRPRRGVGMKCVIQTSDQHRWSIRLLFHHACCDGVGAIRMIGQFAKAYTQVRGTGLSHPAVNPSPSQRADRTPSSVKQTTAVTSPQLPDMNNLWATIRGKNVRLSQQDIVGDTVCCDVPGTTIATFQGSSRLMFSRSQSDLVRQQLRQKKITLNDWAVAVTLHTFANVTNATESPRNHVMIMNPVETRTWAQRHDTDNHVGIAFVRRTHGQLLEVQHTLDSVSEQMQNVRRCGTGNELAGGIAFAERVAGCVGLFERLGTFTPTASLTSVAGLRLGKRFGVHRQDEGIWISDAQLVDVFFEAPIQNGGQVSTTIWEFEGQVAVSHRVSPGLFDGDQNRHLLNLWAKIALDAILEPTV